MDGMKAFFAQENGELHVFRSLFLVVSLTSLVLASGGVSVALASEPNRR